MAPSAWQPGQRSDRGVTGASPSTCLQRGTDPFGLSGKTDAIWRCLSRSVPIAGVPLRRPRRSPRPARWILDPVSPNQSIAAGADRKPPRRAELITSAHNTRAGRRRVPADRPRTYALVREVPVVELRQLRYFVTVAEELHFGRAAAQEHIVQSALSQQIQRLERELGVRLLERSTHHVALTVAGAAFLVEARQILAHVDRAVAIARNTGSAVPALRVGIIDASYDSMPQILQEAQAHRPGLVVHQIEAGVPEQYRLLADGRLDVGIGRAALAPPHIASQVFRHDPLGVLLPREHRFAELDAVPVGDLAREPLLLAEEAQAPEFNQFTIEMCRAAGFTPTVYAGTVESIRAAADLVAQGRCLYCVPSSCVSALPGTLWRPLTEPASYYPWSVLWRADDDSDHVTTIVTCARTLSARLGWLTTPDRFTPD
ncbi:LysR family transcriptional regulator [Actinomadura sp. KC216]|nr:LysR family transcriptional regulator [Actinomadura sp. KC216]